MGNITTMSYIPHSQCSSGSTSDIFGGITNNEQMVFLEGIIDYELHWEDICIKMITDKTNKITIKTIPVITKKIALAAVKHDRDEKIGARVYLLQKWTKECEFLNSNHNEYECDNTGCTQCGIECFVNQNHVE